MINGVRLLVLMSTYNGEQYVEQQIRSIMSQRGIEDIKLRIRDDGSNDNTVKIISKLMSEYSDRIQLIEGDNIGYNASFFELLKHAEGYDYYAISDQDDIWLPEKLFVGVKSILKYGESVPVLYASTSYLVENDLIPYGQTRRKYREFTLFNTIIQNICPGHTQIFNNELLKYIKEDVDTSKIYVYDSWITNLAMLYGTIVYNNSSYTLYRQHKGNQLGSGTGKIGKLIASAKRTESGHGYRYFKQIEYFVEKHSEKINQVGCYDELNRFINSRTFGQKLRYSLTGKLYRQKPIESLAFYCAVILGMY